MGRIQRQPPLRRRVGLSAAALAIPLALGCGPAPKPNVLVVTFDTTRYDRFGATGDPEAHTPVVDALAARGVLFERAFASVPITLPSHTTIFTGLEPLVHGVHNNGRFRVPDSAETLAERLQKVGYESAAFVSAFVLDHAHNLGQGFDVYSDEVDAESNPFSMLVPQRDGAATTDEARAWLAGRSGERPFLLWVHYYDPHQPRTVKPTFQGLADGYRSEISYADEQLGRLLEAVDEADGGRGTLVVFTADHGEGLGEHDEDTHAILAYDATLHVPLVLAGPGVPTGVRSRAFARHIDLVPTVLTLLGLPVSAELSGRNLLAGLGRDGIDADVLGYFECRLPAIDLGWESIEGVRTPRWKYTAAPAPVELYDVMADPGETKNLAAEQPDVVAQLEALHGSLGAKGAAAPGESQLVEVDPELSAKLAALGYVEAPARFAEGARPDPRRFVASQRWISTARSMASSGAHQQAIELLESLVESPSLRPLALRTLAPIYERTGRIEDALSAYARYLERSDSAEARFEVARLLIQAGRIEEGLHALDGVGVASRTAVRLRAHALAQLGQFAEARQVLDQGYPGTGPERLRERARLVLETRPAPDAETELRALLAQAPADPVLRSSLGFWLAVRADRTQAGEALALLRELAAERSEQAEVRANLGWGLHRLGQQREAAAELAAALEREPDRLLERVRLGFVLAQLGDAARARHELELALRYDPAAVWAGEARARLRELEARAAAAG